nr:hypothetical protein [Ruminococcus sp.]
HKARLEAEKAKKAEQERLEAERKAAENATNATLSASDNFSIEEIKDGPERSCNSGNKSENNEPKEVSGGFIELFKHILNEDPDEIINQQNDSTEQDEKRRKKKLKRTAYSVFGVIFAVFACIGLIAVVAKGIDMIGTFKSRDPNRENFEKFLYPAVIMDIESFETPAELTSEQILTAAIWSMIMTDGITEQYELTFDVVMIPAADVEAYAVKLFGNELPELVHTTVGPAESRFYYNEETQLYNVPVAPVTHTYSPEVRGATKSGDDYILVVDYIDELPAWLPRTSSKSVEFVITSTDNGYHLKSMKILTTSTNTV